MNPALSVIFFTSLSGAGYGVLVIGGVLVGSGMMAFSVGPAIGWLGTGVALATAGLLISTAHLHHPERAWRALSQWRSSWLSREGVASIATYLPAVALGWGWLVTGFADSSHALAAWMLAVLAATTVYCTARIYSSLKTIRQWHHPLVTPLYLLFSIASGSAVLLAVLGIAGGNDPRLAIFAMAALVIAWSSKWAYWRSVGSGASDSTPATATGLEGEVRMLDPAHTGENYLLKEMGYTVARRHAARIRRLALGFGLFLPVVLIAVAGGGSGPVTGLLQVLAALSVLAGVIAERWLFFAEATHTVMLYYGARSG